MDVDIQQSQDIASGKDNIVVSVTKAVSLTTEELSAMNMSLEQAFPSNED